VVRRRASTFRPHKFFDVVAESVDEVVARRGIIYFFWVVLKWRAYVACLRGVLTWSA